ncbi:phosphate/phosphite/phosphonate ABC transporter substrate-binding protein [Ovoidimarina sediminis]|uniref:phosphate/phosphite/phosphonate ABC transporter substrate-binding protein n=1 Tax=Ovoidimarina sediminis TaxID=3079856 RepID=UPI00290CDF54|nr:PhnD/SsuA/transferrin family substrate-binding protein [Rhodophyticola sp. MJ-SS7]MDU8942729.1 PhnD/SsuA/transferrin family substrate-binding protein [Rhodophyticola sp. MJ-SS7]
MIATLPMYLFPETRAGYEALWDGIRDALRDTAIDAPDALTHDIPPMDGWAAPDLVLGHICNLPYRARFRDRVTLIGAADFGLDGCGPGEYRALYVVRQDHPAETVEDLDGATMAYSEPLSHSGWGAAATEARAAGRRYRPTLQTGSHAGSAEAVSRGQAEFATIDAQTFRILARHTTLTRNLRVIGATEPSPGITFITRAGQDPAPYLAAINTAISGLSPLYKENLRMISAVSLPTSAYDLPLPPAPAPQIGPDGP